MNATEIILMLVTKSKSGITDHLEKRLNFHDYTPDWKGMERYKEGPYFQEIQEIWPFLIPFHTFPIRSIAMEIQYFFPVDAGREWNKPLLVIQNHNSKEQ